MRIAATLILALCCACAGGRREYDACGDADVGLVRCGLACPGGGIGCGDLDEVAVLCDSRGGTSWYAISDCQRCSESIDHNSVECGDAAAAISEHHAPCSEGEACSADGRLALHCVDGEYRVKESCDAPKSCALVGSSVGCK